MHRYTHKKKRGKTRKHLSANELQEDLKRTEVRQIERRSRLLAKLPNLCHTDNIKTHNKVKRAHQVIYLSQPCKSRHIIKYNFISI